jgi:predicted nucleic acid-binding protein
MPPIVVVSDASVALKWFHEAGEEQVDEARALVSAYIDERIELYTLDLTAYEVGNALLRGRAAASAAQVAEVLTSLAQVCPRLSLAEHGLESAAKLADEHRLTFYDAAYAAAARDRGGILATMDRELLAAGLGHRPSDIIQRIPT